MIRARLPSHVTRTWPPMAVAPTTGAGRAAGVALDGLSGRTAMAGLLAGAGSSGIAAMPAAAARIVATSAAGGRSAGSLATHRAYTRLTLAPTPLMYGSGAGST